MEIKQINTGVFVDEKEVIAIQLINEKGNHVKIFNYGAIVNELVVKNAKGDFQDIVLGFDDISGYLNPDYLVNYPYFGAIIGRYANRIKDGKFSIDGTEYQLAKNNAENCLHGGEVGFDRKVWDLIETSKSPLSATFQYFSLDGEENFPGDLAVQVKFEFTNHDELILTYHADTDEATAINLTHHGYFNLSASGNQVMDHIHEMPADYMLEQDQDSVVTGKLIPVGGTLHDFRKGKKIGHDWDKENGYDQTYVLNKTYGELTLASKTTSPDGSLALAVYTTEPVAHLYTSKYLAVKNGKKGRNYGEFDAFCVETQHHPNAVNILSFPNTILRPEEVYTQTTIYKVIV
jgi:aldose 1-epimerase